MSFTFMLKSLLRRKVITLLLLVQLGITLALVVNSIILAQQAHQLANQPTGLDLDNTLNIQLRLTDRALAQQPLLNDLIERQLHSIRQLPGVIAAAYANQPPLQQGGTNGNVYVEGHEERTNLNNVPFHLTGEQIAEALSLQLKKGRLLTASDKDTGNIIITESLATALFGDTDPLGQQTSTGTVVGVVADILSQRYADNMYHALFVNMSLFSGSDSYHIQVRTAAGQHDTVRRQLADLLRKVEPETDIQNISSLRMIRDKLYQSERGFAILLSVLSAMMLLVAMISAYSHALFHGLKQQNEIGIKRALGASKHRILLDVLSESWLTTVTGACIGILLSYLLQQQLAKVLSVPALPWWLPVAASLLLLCCVTVATWYPAKLATRVSPATATKTL